MGLYRDCYRGYSGAYWEIRLWLSFGSAGPEVPSAFRVQGLGFRA